MADTLSPSRRTAPVPAPLRLSIVLWLAAVAAGVAETVVRLALPDPPGTGELAARTGVYMVVVALVLALATGRPAVRWTLAVLLGVVGTFSLVAEPAAWLAAGNSPAAFLAGADLPTLLVVGLRTVHLLAVVGALAAMFTPRVNAFFSRTA